MLAQMVAMITSEDHDGIVSQACLIEGGQHLAHLGVHVGNRGIVAADGFLLATEVHLHV